MVNIRMGGVPEYFNLPILLALEQGRFAEAGIHLEWQDVPEGTGKMVRALEAGQLDLVIALTEGTVKSIAQGNPAKIIHTYVQSPLNWVVHTHATSEAHAIEDLEGKTFAISRYGSGSHLMGILMAQTYGWDPAKLSFEEVQNLDGARQALENNTAQIFLWEKYTTKFLVEKGEFKRVGEFLTPWPCFVIAAADKILEKEHGTIKTLLEVILQSVREFTTSEQATAQVVERYQLNRKDVEDFLPVTQWNTQMTLPTAEAQKALTTLQELGQLQSAQKIVTQALH